MLNVYRREKKRFERFPFFSFLGASLIKRFKKAKEETVSKTVLLQILRENQIRKALKINTRGNKERFLRDLLTELSDVMKGVNG